MSPVKCPKCGKINDGNLDFCIYCGAIFEESKGDEIVIDLKNIGKNNDSYSPFDSINYPNDKKRSEKSNDSYSPFDSINYPDDKKKSEKSNDSYSPFDSINYPNDEKRSEKSNDSFHQPKTLYKYLVIIGYITAVLGGLLGFVISIFLITRKDPYAKQHGWIQLSILICWVMLIAALVLTGQMDLSVLMNPMNTSQLENLTSNISSNSSNLFGF